MKMRTFALLLLATAVSSLAAMPTKQELKQVEVTAHVSPLS